ncbi:hypothetical protein [Thermanaerovibrio acidaminovorans]|jgi:hypothetical protein|uniref:hypothetical protein n=1 Tax=Thermanaerovibrio acidaminovorans TaxID=81462 RepID=UPI00248F9D04|nr:hypothetical protein [Thermanaerovibrio acidaminovorans]
MRILLCLALLLTFWSPSQGAPLRIEDPVLSPIGSHGKARLRSLVSPGDGALLILFSPGCRSCRDGIREALGGLKGKVKVIPVSTSYPPREYLEERWREWGFKVQGYVDPGDRIFRAIQVREVPVFAFVRGEDGALLVLKVLDGRATSGHLASQARRLGMIR